MRVWANALDFESKGLTKRVKLKLYVDTDFSCAEVPYSWMFISTHGPVTSFSQSHQCISVLIHSSPCYSTHGSPQAFAPQPVSKVGCQCHEKALLDLLCRKIFFNYLLIFSALGILPTHCNFLLHLHYGEKILFKQRELMTKLLSLFCVYSVLFFCSGFFPRWRGWTLEIINPWDLLMVYKNFKNNLLYNNDFLIDSVRNELRQLCQNSQNLFQLLMRVVLFWFGLWGGNDEG